MYLYMNSHPRGVFGFVPMSDRVVSTSWCEMFAHRMY